MSQEENYGLDAPGRATTQRDCRSRNPPLAIPIATTGLACVSPKRHIDDMVARSSESTNGKEGKHDARVLGRSAATGRFILRPASKVGSITIKEANTAVKSVSHKKK